MFVSVGLIFHLWCPQSDYNGLIALLRSLTDYESRIFELDEIYLPDHITLNPEKPIRFNGPPSPKLEKAWYDLTQCKPLRSRIESCTHEVVD